MNTKDDILKNAGN